MKNSPCSYINILIPQVKKKRGPLRELHLRKLIYDWVYYKFPISSRKSFILLKSPKFSWLG